MWQSSVYFMCNAAYKQRPTFLLGMNVYLFGCLHLRFTQSDRGRSWSNRCVCPNVYLYFVHKIILDEFENPSQMLSLPTLYQQFDLEMKTKLTGSKAFEVKTWLVWFKILREHKVLFVDARCGNTILISAICKFWVCVQ